MNHIKSYYSDYSQLVKEVGDEKIQSRYEFLFQEMTEFIKRLNAAEKIVVNERLLIHAVLEYYEDICKVKAAHDLTHTNDPKVIAYTSYWLLRRKPLLLLSTDDEAENLVFANEKFVLSFIMEYLLYDQESQPLSGDKLNIYKGFLDSLYYYLKF